MDSVEEEMDEANRNGAADADRKSSLILGTGRELGIFDNRQSCGNDDDSDDEFPASSLSRPASTRVRTSTTTDSRGGGSDSYFSSSRQSSPPSSPYDSDDSSFSSYNRAGGRTYSGSRYNQRRSFFQPVTDWWSANVSPNIKNLPKIQCRVEPTTTLKIRKTFRPLKTIVRLSAHFNTQQGVWQFRSSWEDAIIGGKLTLAGKELQLAKSWQLSVGPVEDLVTRLRLRAAVDLQTWKAYVRVGFRTERLSPINVMEGFSLLKQIPLDGNDGHIKLEVKANFALPEPEIEYSTETQRSLIGMGDIEVGIEEMNLLLDY